jgi:hypothetical protein
VLVYEMVGSYGICCVSYLIILSTLSKCGSHKYVIGDIEGEIERERGLLCI